MTGEKQQLPWIKALMKARHESLWSIVGRSVRNQNYTMVAKAFMPCQHAANEQTPTSITTSFFGTTKYFILPFNIIIQNFSPFLQAQIHQSSLAEYHRQLVDKTPSKHATNFGRYP